MKTFRLSIVIIILITLGLSNITKSQSTSTYSYFVNPYTGGTNPNLINGDKIYSIAYAPLNKLEILLNKCL